MGTAPTVMFYMILNTREELNCSCSLSHNACICSSLLCHKGLRTTCMAYCVARIDLPSSVHWDYCEFSYHKGWQGPLSIMSIHSKYSVVSPSLLSLWRYYPLEVSYFKSSLDSHLLDLLWNKYWVNTLSSCSITTVSTVYSCTVYVCVYCAVEPL